MQHNFLIKTICVSLFFLLFTHTAYSKSALSGMVVTFQLKQEYVSNEVQAEYENYIDYSQPTEEYDGKFYYLDR